MEANGLDHDDGIDGVTTEKSAVLRRPGQLLGGVPIFASAQMQKDKTQASFQARAPRPPASQRPRCAAGAGATAACGAGSAALKLQCTGLCWFI